MSEREERLKRLKAFRYKPSFGDPGMYEDNYMCYQDGYDTGYEQAKADVMKELHEVLLMMGIQGIQAQNAEVWKGGR